METPGQIFYARSARGRGKKQRPPCCLLFVARAPHPRPQEGLLEGRMFFSCSKGYPTMVSSVIHYKPQEEQARRVRQKWIDERGAEAFQIPKRCGV